MGSDGFSRRRLLQGLGITGGGVLASGYISQGSDTSTSSEPRMVSRYTTDEVTRSVVTSSTLPDTAHPYFATVVPSAEKADEVFDVDVLPEHARSDWNSIRYENEFVAVFLTDINVLPEKDASGSEPATSIEGDSFVFSIPVVADEERYRDRIYTVLEKWSLNGGQKPNNAAVQLRYPDRT